MAAFSLDSTVFGGFGRTVTGCPVTITTGAQYDQGKAIEVLNSPIHDVQMIGAKSKNIPFNILVAYIERSDEKKADQSRAYQHEDAARTGLLRAAAFKNLTARKLNECEAGETLKSVALDIQMLGARSDKTTVSELIAYIERLDKKIAEQKGAYQHEAAARNAELRKAAMLNLSGRKI